MNLEVGPIFRALMRNKMGAILIALQIAVTMTVLANGFFIIENRKTFMARESGMDVSNSFVLDNFGYAPNFNMSASRETDLDFIRRLPSVISATSINTVPMSNSGWSMGLATESGPDTDPEVVAIYMVDEHGAETLDIELIAGENFSPAEIAVRDDNTTQWPNSALLTQAMIKALWPDKPVEEAVGKTVYIDDTQPMIIKGVIDHLQAPWIGWSAVDNVMLSPSKVGFSSISYLIRTQPGTLNDTLNTVQEKLSTSTSGRLIRRVRTMQQIYDRSYQQDSGMITILTSIMIILTIITALGIVGLASFSVNRRKKQIGTRRALGASRHNIVRYFMIENFIVSAIGVVLGAILTIGLNIILVQYFSLDAIEWYYIPISMISLCLVGQIAVLGPAQKASGISPATATRSA
jgi:putative ABC transport system permease protein